MKIYREKDFASLYYLSLRDLMNSPDHEISPRNKKIKENTNVALILEDPLSCLYQNEVRSSQKKYISAELLWYFMGRNDVSFIRRYAKFWDSIKNEDDTVNSAYGHLLFSRLNEYGYGQYQWALISLQKDPESRQAIMHFNLPSHQYLTNKDFVCTMYGIFQIRENRLNLTVSMRSNDVVWGLPTDIAFFAVLQCQMLVHLNKLYPDLKLGTYTHIANSFHIYEHHFDLIGSMLDHQFTAESIPAVDLSLIDSVGCPSGDFIYLFNNYESITTDSYSDPLFSWILKNLKA